MIKTPPANGGRKFCIRVDWQGRGSDFKPTKGAAILAPPNRQSILGQN
jgi:hypothetical protein